MYKKVTDMPSPFFYVLFKNDCMLLKNKHW